MRGPWNRPKMEHCFLSHCGVPFFAHDMMPKWSPRIPHPWCTPGRSFGSETKGIEWRKTLVKQFEGFTNFSAWDVLIVDILIFMLLPYIRIAICYHHNLRYQLLQAWSIKTISLQIDFVLITEIIQPEFSGCNWNPYGNKAGMGGKQHHWQMGEWPKNQSRQTLQ